MSSVKGLTWGTPEFVEIAKRGEREGEVDEIITNLIEEGVWELRSFEINEKQREILREHRKDIEDILGEYGCYGECEGFK